MFKIKFFYLDKLCISVLATILMVVFTSPSPSHAAECVVADNDAVIVMFDFQRDMETRKSDVAILDSLARIYASRIPDALIRTQFVNLENGNLNDVQRCKLFTETKFVRTVERAKAMFVLEHKPVSRHYDRATQLEDDFRQLILSLGQMKVRPETNKIVIIFSNLDYYFGNDVTGKSTRGYYLNDGWLTSSASPFGQVLAMNSDRFEGAKVFVVTDGKDSLSVRKGKREFFANFFKALGGDLYHFGPGYSLRERPSPVLNRYFELLLDDELTTIPANLIGKGQLLQAINRQGSRNFSTGDFK